MRKLLFPEIHPYREHRIQVSNLHELYIEESGNPKGQPVLFLHGGPGGGTNPNQRRFFDPSHYRIILFDQRGCGQSKPYGCIDENTLSHLIDDIEKIRIELRIQNWLIFGGSWGSTLALAYAEAHPECVTHLILRGIFLCRKEEIQWFYHEGASWIWPEEWERFTALIPKTERGELVLAYYKRLTSRDSEVQLEAALAWVRWEAATSHLLQNEETIQKFIQPSMALALARIESHYFAHDSFLKPNQILNAISRIRHIPAKLIQGRYDLPCPVKSCWDLARAFPEASLQIFGQSGYSAGEQEIQTALLSAGEDFKI